MSQPLLARIFGPPGHAVEQFIAPRGVIRKNLFINKKRPRAEVCERLARAALWRVAPAPRSRAHSRLRRSPVRPHPQSSAENQENASFAVCMDQDSLR